MSRRSAKRKKRTAPAPTRRPATPALAGRAVSQTPTTAVELTPFDEAWFAHGEQLQHGDGAEEGISDYASYQSLLERLALQTP